MAISIPSATSLETPPPVALTPVANNAATVAPLSTPPQPDTSVLVTLGTGIQAIFVYNANGVVQQVLFGPPLAAAASPVAQTPSANAGVETPGTIPAAPAPQAAANAIVENLATALEVEQALAAVPAPATALAAPPAGQNTVAAPAALAPVITPAITAANTPVPAALPNTLSNTLQQEALIAVTVNTVAALENPALVTAQVEQALALPQATGPTALPTAIQNTLTAEALAPAIPAPGAPLSTVQQQLSEALQLNAQATVAAPVATLVPTTAAINATLQNLFLQAANQANFNITTNPSYANSLAALILSSVNANIRLIDETGVLLGTSQPVHPVQRSASSRAVV